MDQKTSPPPSGSIPIDEFKPDAENASELPLESQPLVKTQAQAQAPVPQPSSTPTLPRGAIPVDQFVSDEEKFGTPGQQLLSGIEGVGKGLLGPIATGAEQLLSRAGVPGISAKERAGRESANPVLSGVGEGLGFIGGALSGTGEAALLDHIGQGVVPLAEAAGIGGKGAGVLAKIGSGAARGAVENALFQLGSEGSRYLNDPSSVQDALPHLGLAAVIGGTLGGAGGGISSLWKSSGASEGLASFLNRVKNKVGGIEGEAALSPISDLVEKTGLEIPPEVQAGLSDDPMLKNAFQTLEQSDATNSGRAFQETLSNFKNEAGKAVSETLGVKPENIPQEFDLYSSGRKIGETLSKEVDQRVAPLKAAYEDFADQFSGKEISKGTRDLLGEKVAQLAQNEGWTVSPSSDLMRETNRVLNELPNIKNLKNLSDYIKAVGDNTAKDIQNKPLLRAGMKIKSILRDAEGELIGSHIGSEQGPAVLDSYRATQKAYAAESALREEVEDRLGRFSSTSGYGKEIGEMAKNDGEKIFNRLSGKNDADALRLLSEHFPETANAVKEALVQKLLASSQSAGELNSERLLTHYKKLSPQLKEFITPAEGKQRIDGITKVLDSLKDPKHNFSNTARVVDKAFQYIPGSAVGLVSMLVSHNPAVSLLLGGLTKYLSKDAPDAARLALLKWMGSSKPVAPGAFKTMFDLIHAAQKGNDLTSQAARAIFSASGKVIPEHLMPSSKKVESLDQTLKDLAKRPGDLLNAPGDVGHYLPDHAGSIAQTAANAVTYLNSQRPVSLRKNPLDTELPVSKDKIASFNRTLQIAQQPLLVLKHLKEGTLLPSDVNTLKIVAPAYYAKLSETLTHEMMDQVNRGKEIPYSLRQGLSRLLGQPLDSTLSAQATASLQSVFTNGNKPTSQAQGSSAKPKHSTSKLGKLSQGLQTPDQARIARTVEG